VSYILEFLSSFIVFSRYAKHADSKGVRAGCRPYYIAQSSSGGFGLQPGPNNTSIGAILGKLCDREDIGFAKRPACADLVVLSNTARSDCIDQSVDKIRAATQRRL
jgi:hypothetical protein